jgi:thiamine pyrophosphokinase
MPNMIIGDLDSLHEDVATYYKEHKVHIEEDGDQYSTDFGKAMKVLTNGYPDRNFPSLPSSVNSALSKECENVVQDIIILGTIAGRVDQGLGLLHEIYREYQHHGKSVRLWLFSEQNITFLLGPGKNIITGINPKVGIFPSIFPVEIGSMHYRDVLRILNDIFSAISISLNHTANTPMSIYLM